MVRHDELMKALAGWSPSLGNGVERDTPLLSSGRLDSVALFQLLLWIENKVGHSIDVTAIDMPAEWNTVDSILAFIEREKS
jgi:acyl carrier protein